MVWASGAYAGGLMVVDLMGLPLDFRYTEPVTPTRLQEVLYARTLDRYMRAELLFKHLCVRIEPRPALLLVDDEILLTQAAASTVVYVAETRLPPPRSRRRPPRRQRLRVAAAAGGRHQPAAVQAARPPGRGPGGDRDVAAHGCRRGPGPPGAVQPRACRAGAGMCPLRRPRLIEACEALSSTVQDGALAPLTVPLDVKSVPLGLPEPQVAGAFEPLSSRRLRLRGRRDLATVLGVSDTPPTVRVVAAPEVARRVPMTRELVPAEALGPAEVDRWLERVANARRVSRSRLELVGVFPDLPLTEASTIKLDAARGLARFTLEEGVPRRTTIAVTRRKDTGESVVARLPS
jgi:hypothetical protein